MTSRLGKKLEWKKGPWYKNIKESETPSDEWLASYFVICGEDSQAQPSWFGFKLVRE